ncbi:MAG: glycosyltransferase [Lachnospiraceae bacterium]|jgi:Glycosyltransferases, probably involved in cell wall biogenesis
MSLAQNIRKTINYSKKNGYTEAAVAAWERVTAKYYANYDYHAPNEEVLARQRADKSVSDIKFSILVPAYETQAVYMSALIESCIVQTYENWELVIADGSEKNTVSDLVHQYQDTRIRYVCLEGNNGIAENTNQAIASATGDYYGLLDHDDLLTPDALYEMARAVQKSRPILAYSDEDKCDISGKHFYDPHFKLDFNLDLLLTNNYICHFMAVRADILKKLQIRKEYDGSQDYDIILRIVSNLLIKEKENKEARPVEEFIVHVPKVLYHWRCHENSTADNPQSKMYAYEAGKKALIDFASRMGWKVDVRHNKHLGFYRIEYGDSILTHRPDLAAVGGFVTKRGKVISGIYQGQPLLYAGYMNRMDLYQNTTWLDLRNMAVNKAYQSVYEDVTGHSYISTLPAEEKELPQWIQDLGRTTEGNKKLMELSQELCKRLIKNRARLLLDPVCVRKI